MKNQVNSDTQTQNSTEISFFSVPANVRLKPEMIVALKRNIDRILRERLTDPEIGHIAQDYVGAFEQLYKHVDSMDLLKYEYDVCESNASDSAINDVNTNRKTRKQEFFNSIDNYQEHSRKAACIDAVESLDAIYSKRSASRKRRMKLLNEHMG